jgi:hypothetical protein
VRKPGVLVIAGHTHYPIFPSPSRFELLTTLYDDLRHRPDALENEEIEKLEADLAFARSQEEPCFINTGCCSFSDGSCTGIEIVSGDARLVRWQVREGRPQREVLDSALLAQLLTDVAPEGKPISIP